MWLKDPDSQKLPEVQDIDFSVVKQVEAAAQPAFNPLADFDASDSDEDTDIFGQPSTTAVAPEQEPDKN